MMKKKTLNKNLKKNTFSVMNKKFKTNGSFN